MHYLKHILIDLEKVGIDYTNLEKDEIVDAVLSYANSYLYDYYGDWYDWKEDNAGRWLSEYPDSCLTGKFHKDEFLKVIKSLQFSRLDSLYFYLSTLNEVPGIIEKTNESITITLNRERLEEMFKDDRNGFEFYILKRIVQILADDLDYDSILINTIEESNFISNSLMKELINNPDRYAIALIDIHS